MDRTICLTPRLLRTAASGRPDAAGGDEFLEPLQTILYVDSQRLTRDCVGQQLALHIPEATVETASSASDVSEDDVGGCRFTLGIVNKHASHITDAEVTLQLSCLAELAPCLALVVFSDVDDADEIAQAFKLGVRGYIPMSVPIKQAAEAIRLIGAGGSFVPPSVLALSRQVAQAQPSEMTYAGACAATFTPRQMEVLQRLWQGKQNKVIAYDLNMCESTVKVHIRHIMKKLHARNRTQIVLLTRTALQPATPA
jgi:DNA-binding NarL/FixJ family response regulator